MGNNNSHNDSIGILAGVNTSIVVLALLILIILVLRWKKRNARASTR